MLSLKGRLVAVFCSLLAGLPAALAQSSVRVNEVCADNISILGPDDTITDWVELVNTSGVAVNLSGASLTDDELIPDKWMFPPGTTIPANGYLLIKCDLEAPASFDLQTYMNAGFNLSASGDGVFLYGANFGPLIDGVYFGAQVGDLTVGRVGGIWKLCAPTPAAANVAQALGSPTGLRVNEWFANGTGEDDWFEIYNTGNLPVAFDGLYITDEPLVKTKWPVPALTFIGIGREAYVEFIADGNTNKGPNHADFSLRAAGEAIAIFDSLGTEIDSITFSSQPPDTSEGRLPDGAALKTSFPGSASPGEPNFKEITTFHVSELLSHTDPPLEDAVEFYNATDAPIDISGWYLSNSKSDLKRYRIPTGTVIPAKGYKVIYEQAFNANNPLVAFTFNSAHGDQVYLAEADAQGNLTGYRVGEDFEAAENGVSFGRVETSVADVHQFVAMASRTFGGAETPSSLEEFRTGTGAANSDPLVGPIVINEVMFHPLSVDGTDNRTDEFIELFNTTTSAVRLYDANNPGNTWRLQNGVSYSFPLNQTIPALGYALVVSFDPSLDPIALSNFKFKYNVPNTVKIYGPFRGDLNNSGDSLELYKPDRPQGPGSPDEGFVPYLRVDKVNYTDRAPWPAGADGTGNSLQKKNSTAFGNDRIYWDAGLPTPGAGNSAAVRDTDADGAPDVWEDQYSFDKNNPADGAIDTDGDGFTNVQEYIAGTDPRQAGDRLAITSLTPAQNEFFPLKLSFPAAANRSYRVEYRNSLAVSAAWQKLETFDPATTNRVITVEDPGALGRTDRYYQVVVSN